MLSARLSIPELKHGHAIGMTNPNTRRFVHSGPLHDQGAAPFNFPTPTADRDRTVSRDVLNPASRVPLLNGEQPYPWDRLQPRDVMSRTSRVAAANDAAVDMNSWRYQPVIPGVPLSVERWPFHSEPPDRRLADNSCTCSNCHSRSQAAYAIALTTRCPTVFSPPSCSSVAFWEETASSQTTHRALSVIPIQGFNVRTSKLQGVVFQGRLHHI